MKKLIIIISLLILGSCSNSSSEVQVNPSPQPSPLEERGNPVETKDVLSLPEEKQETIKINSPVYTLTGEVLSGTTKIEITWKNSDKTDSYELKKFKVGDKEFLSNLRLDYSNIAKGTNEYEVNFIKADGSKEVRKYLVDAEYDEIKVGDDKILYMKNERNFLGNRDNKPLNQIESITTSACYNENFEKIILIKENNQYNVLPECFSFSIKNDFILTYKKSNIVNNENKCPKCILYDIYEGNNLLMRGFPLTYSTMGDMGIGNPIYNKNDKKIFYNRAGGDVNAGFGNYYIYNIDKNSLDGYRLVTIGQNFGNDGYVFSETTLGNIDNNYNLLITENTDTPEKIASYYSLIKKDKDFNEKYRKNYLYNTSYSLTLDEKQFYENKDEYKIKLGDDEKVINFKDLNEKQIKMSSLEKDGYFALYKFYLEQNSDNYAIVMQSPQEIEKIGVTSCKGNNSSEYDEEYILKTKEVQEDGSSLYKYNISEKLNNKCDIPYKINLYYADGKVVSGEYYLIF